MDFGGRIVCAGPDDNLPLSLFSHSKNGPFVTDSEVPVLPLDDDVAVFAAAAGVNDALIVFPVVVVHEVYTVYTCV